MSQTFALRKGEITFDSNTIIITDHAKVHKYLSLSGSVAWIIFGIGEIVKYQLSDNDTLLWAGIILGGINVILFIINLRRSTKSIVSLNDIEAIQVKQRFNNTFVDIRLKNNRIRRVLQPLNAEELKKYIARKYPFMET